MRMFYPYVWQAYCHLAEISQKQGFNFYELTDFGILLQCSFLAIYSSNQSLFLLKIKNCNSLFIKPGTFWLVQLAYTWFLRIDPVWIVGMHVHVCVRACVCLCLRLLITSGVIWCDMNLIQLVKKVLQLLYDNYSHYC